MPIIKSAKKKLRKDIKRATHNASLEASIKQALKKARRNPNPQNLSTLYSLLDKAVKTHLIHKNKAARLKSKAAALQSQLARTQPAGKPKAKPRKR